MTSADPIPPAIRQSTELHQRVKLFAQSCDEALFMGEGEDTFTELALDIARFQREHSPGFARLVTLGGGQLESLDDLPIVPTDAFRLTRVAVHPPELDQAVYRTSGTSSDMTGLHPVRDLSTKEELSLLQAKRTLFSDYGRGVVVCLAPEPEEVPTSSLAHMMELFIEHFDARPLISDPTGAAFSSRENGRWLLGTHGIDLDGLHRACRLARHRSEPLYLLCTSFALAATLEMLEGERLNAPARTVIMLTGGFKGHSTTLSEDVLRQAASEVFQTPRTHIWGEYGMTELSSQLFEHHQKSAHSTAPRDQLAWWQRSGGEGLYVPPPWLKIRPLDPRNYRQQPRGEAGLAQFIDLANVDSCVSLVTQDLVREEENGYRLLGRAPRAPARGCSLPFEGFLMPRNTSGKGRDD